MSFYVIVFFCLLFFFRLSSGSLSDMAGINQAPNDITEACARLTLGEGGVCEILIPDSIETEATQESLLTLMGRFHGDRNADFESMRQTLAYIWKPMDGVTISKVPGVVDRFLFRFYSEFDLSRVVDGGPWTFKGQVMCFKTLEKGVQPSKVELYHTPIWVQLHDLPPGFV